MTIIRSYRELSRLETFDERLDYLMLNGNVGRATFGFDRWINQQFYNSYEWKQIREFVIVRDNGCDLGVPGYEINAELLVHHMNPLDAHAIVHREDSLLDPENLITTTHRTHNAIHYSDKSLLPQVVPEREPGDTTLW